GDGVGIEGTVVALGEASQLGEYLAGENVGTFLEDKEGRASGRGVVKAMRGLLDHVADKDDRVDLLLGMLLAHVREDLADLGLAGHARNRSPRVGQLARVHGPMAPLAFL